MDTYAITFKPYPGESVGDTITFEAAFYEISEGFVRVFVFNENKETLEEISVYNSDTISAIHKQNEYTEQEVIDQLKASDPREGNNHEEA